MIERWKLALILFSISLTSRAEECMVSTAPPDRLALLPAISSKANFESTGMYAVSFENGDQILAKYGICELSLRAHYLVRSKAFPDISTIKAFIKAVAPSEKYTSKLTKQLNATEPLKLNQPLLLTGHNDSHILIIKSGSSDFFPFEIHYEWQPPLH